MRIKTRRTSSFRRLTEAEYDVSEGDIAELIEEIFAEAEEADYYYTSAIRLMTPAMARQLKKAGFTYKAGKLVLDKRVDEEEFEAVMEERGLEAEDDGWHGDGDVFLRYSRGYVEVGTNMAGWVFEIDPYECWKKTHKFISRLIANDDTEEVEGDDQFHDNPVFHLVWRNHMEEFTAEAMKCATLSDSFIETLEEWRDCF